MQPVGNVFGERNFTMNCKVRKMYFNFNHRFFLFNALFSIYLQTIVSIFLRNELLRFMQRIDWEASAIKNVNN